MGATLEVLAEKALSSVGLTPVGLSAEARAVLADRRRARRSATLWCAPGFAAALFLFVRQWTTVASTPEQSPPDPDASRYYLAAALVLAATELVRFELIRRREVRIGAWLPRRIVRAEATRVRTILGWRLITNLGITLVLHGLLAAWLFTVRGADAGSWCFVTVCASSYVLVAWGVWRTSSRPVVAVDPLSLAADERFRSLDVTVACYPLLLAAIEFGPLAGPHSGEYTQFLQTSPALVAAFFNAASVRRRWRQRPAWLTGLRGSVR